MSYLFKKKKFFFLSFKYLLIFLFILLFYFGINTYPGNKLTYSFFSLLNILLFFFIFRKKSFFFEVFFGLLIFLGFWFKLTITLSITPFTIGQFSEGVGIFDHKPESFDQVIIISSIGIMAFIVAGLFRQLIFSYPNKLIFKTTRNKVYEKYRIKLWLIFLVFSFSIFILNIHLGIYQKGIVSNFKGSQIFSNFFKWFLLFGLTSISSWLLFNEIKLKKITYSSYFISIFEILLSSLSMISRGMIFNSGSIFYGIYKFSNKLNYNFGIKKFSIFLILIFILFYISVISVNHIRANFFYIGSSVTNKVINKDFNNESKKTKKIFTTAKQLNISKQNSEFIYLAINRWVGVDAVMAISAKQEILNFNLLKKAFEERFNRYGPSFYEKNFELKNTISHQIDNNSKGNTLTGIIGFAYYSGSKLFVFLFVFFLSLFASLIEYLSYKLSSKNMIFSSLIGQIIAFRFIHFGYLPHQSYLLISAVFLSIFMIYMLNKVMNILNKK